MKASRTTLTLFGVLAIVLGLAVFAPAQQSGPVDPVSVERPAAAAPATPPPVRADEAVPVPAAAAVQRGLEESRFAARDGETLFGAPRAVPLPPKPVAPPAPPPAPVAVADPTPIVPFVVVGLMEPRGGRPTAWLAEGGRLHVAVAGDVLDDRWRIDAIDRKSVRLTFLPRATQHALPVPSETSR